MTIERMIRSVVKCTICGAGYGQCDCWVRCAACGCSYEKGAKCRRCEHGTLEIVAMKPRKRRAPK